MSILRFLDEARDQTIDSCDAADLRRGLRELPGRYRDECSARESVAGYAVGELRLITLRNEAALATIAKAPDYRDKILDMIARFMVEAAACLRQTRRLRDGDGVASMAPARRTPVYFESPVARISAQRWADTANPMR